jgi:hypothetical protein
MKEAPMRRTRQLTVLAAAVLVVAAQGCDQAPMALDDHAIPVQFSGSAQSRITLCHRTSNGDYTKITIADAAYETHMAHGDRAAGADGGCGSGTVRLEVHLAVDESDFQQFVMVELVPPSGNAIDLEQCHPVEGDCIYDMPTGSTINLTSVIPFHFDWTNASCNSYYATTSSCVMEGDQSVTVSMAY